MNLRNVITVMPTTALQAKVESGSTGLSYWSGLLAALGGSWSKNEILAAGGLLFVALTYFTSLYFQRRRDRREQELHAHKMWMEKRMVEQNNEANN
ncbi:MULTISPECIES: phage holin [unclassified Marinobacter]|uniref:phage holin n=1 Tax=unclassified Marinobacter TaxID=83889 RepID=UPI001926F9A2|nr:MULTISPECIES: phage holin [unclassified Marinobacter]MBL3825153.1 hypothetical protein [Marinobacter sp. MC3]MBL3893643.1 hypothetical protein [Marinobacter sp. MW3]